MAENRERRGAGRRGKLLYARLVGGSSVHFTANFWRLRTRSISSSGAGWAASRAPTSQDWPITYADLEPYYTKVEWEVGVSGGPGPFDPPRSRPYPLPPHAGQVGRGALRAGGEEARPAPAVRADGDLSRPYNGRNACQHCGYCMAFGCEYGAKSSSLACVIPVAEATGRCEIRADSYVRKVEIDARGRATGVIYFDAQKARAAPAGQGGGALRQRRRDAAAAADVGVQAVSRGTRQLERAGREDT